MIGQEREPAHASTVKDSFPSGFGASLLSAWLSNFILTAISCSCEYCLVRFRVLLHVCCQQILAWLQPFLTDQFIKMAFHPQTFKTMPDLVELERQRSLANPPYMFRAFHLQASLTCTCYSACESLSVFSSYEGQFFFKHRTMTSPGVEHKYTVT
jgi:hypothetical protein